LSAEIEELLELATRPVTPGDHARLRDLLTEIAKE